MLDFLSVELFNLNGNPITALEILFVPTLFLVSFILARWLGRVIRDRLSQRHINPDAIQLTLRIFYILVLAIVVITTMDFLNIPLTAFAFVSGAIAIGVGFGAQNIINNFISGWILMWERPIKIGDFLEVADDKGTVESINTRSTRIRRVDGVHMLIPNSFLLENTVVNWTLIDALTRTSVKVGVAYGSPVKRVAELLQQCLDEQPDILKNPQSSVLFDDFGDSALIFEAVLWVNANSEKSLRVLRSDLRFRIDELFRENDIVIAFPQQDVHIDGHLNLIQEKQNP